MSQTLNHADPELVADVRRVVADAENNPMKSSVEPNWVGRQLEGDESNWAIAQALAVLCEEGVLEHWSYQSNTRYLLPDSQ